MKKLVDGKYSFQDLVDIDQLRTTLEDFSSATGYTTSLASYPDHEFLIQTGWRDICTKFHRKYESSKIYCKESNIELTSNLTKQNTINICRCRSGLVDGATPVIVDGVHIATLATGQIFFEEPDMDWFKKQGERYGYHIESYLEAVKETPVVTEERFKKALNFLRNMAVMLAEQALVKHRKQQISDKLKAQKKYAKTLFEDSKIPFVIMNSTNIEILDCNKAAVEIYGYKNKSEVIGKTPKDLSTEKQYDGSDSSKLAKEYFTEALDSGYVVFEWRLKRPSGEIWDAEVQLAKLMINGENFLQFSLTDISERNRIKKEKFLLEKQLNHTRKMDAIGKLAGGVAHDFNNMLGGIMGAAELLKLTKSLDKRSDELVDIIMSASLRATDLIAKLLAFGRKTNDIVKDIDVHSIIDDSIAILSKTIDRNISIKFNKTAENSFIKSDTAGVENAIINLGINASHAMPRGGKLDFATRNIHFDKNYCDVSPFDIAPGDYLEIEVRDTGCGIELDNIERIFEPFFTTKEKGAGTGLGLAAVYGTVQKYNGAITVYSNEGDGTVFHIYFPVVIDEEITVKEKKTEKTVRGTGRILLVDDEEMIRVTGSYILEDAGYEVITAGDGLEALEIYAQNDDIDLVITDMIMPKINGTDTFYKLKEINKDCKVILSSGFTKGESLSELTDAGLAGFIRKPFRNEELTTLLSDILNRSD